MSSEDRDPVHDEAFDEGRARTTGVDDGQEAAEPTLEEALAAGGDRDLAEELAMANDRALRLHAEMQNLRNRTAREIADERRYAAMPLLRDLLPVIDNIDRAIEAAEKAGEAENLLSGLRLVRQQLLSTLAQHHCVPIETEGAAFDPNFHAAILQQPHETIPAGTISLATQTGYLLHDRVVRPAQVIVSSGSPGNPK